MKAAALIFPHQLFASHPALVPGRPAYLVEEPRFFSDFAFHQQKLVLHRASLKAYEDFLGKQGVPVRYLEYGRLKNPAVLFTTLRQDNIREVIAVDPVDTMLTVRLREEAATGDIELNLLENPGFLCSTDELTNFFGAAPKFHQTSFYTHQRRRLNVLMEGDKPAGGRWTYDTENRRKLPKGLEIPSLPTVAENAYVREAKDYVSRHFPDRPGELETFIYPVTHAAAREWLNDFLKRRLPRFGDYQDAISASEPYVFHSLLSPLINIGLLTPREVLNAALAHAGEHPVPMNSLEGFIRQIIGWREYVRGVYVLAGERQRRGNFWGHARKMPSTFYTGETGIAPLDQVIRRLLRTAYAHHIERLMVLGNFMLLCEIGPNEVYRWFMELFLDAYDWVMVPNVYGMSQFADGGLIMTKPYVSGSHYLLKMSDFPRGPWCDIWDGLYWRFIEKHRDYFAKNPRLAPMVKNLERLTPARRTGIFKAAETFLAQLK
jgi:deoxyribodipyrimidine photolyase-related protein